MNATRLFRFWFPLALMWLLMGVEQPVLSAVVARLPNATINLAAFGVAFALALVVESSIIQMLSAATALATSRTQYNRLLSFMNRLALGLTAIHLIVATPPVFRLFAQGLLRVPDEVVGPSQTMFLLMTPFAAFVGYRRLWQGVLIRYGHTLAVTISMVARLVTAAFILSLPFWLPGYNIPGNVLGAIAIVGAVGAGALASWVLFRLKVKPRMQEDPEESAIPWKELLSFYIPLASTSVLLLAARPLLTFGIARSADPVQSLAAWPVIQGYLFLFSSIALSFQEAVIAVLGEDKSNAPLLRRFGLITGLVLSAGFLITAVTDISDLWYGVVMGLEPQLLPLTVPAMLVLIPTPFFVSVKSWYRGVLVHTRTTRSMAGAVAVNVTVLFGLVLLLPIYPSPLGTVVAAVAWVSSVGVENIVLRRAAGRHGL